MSETKITRGNRLEILPEFQDQGDDTLTWYATEDEDGGRVNITYICDNLNYPSVQRVETRMLRKLGTNVTFI